MQVVDEVTGYLEPIQKTQEVVIGHTPKQIITGYTCSNNVIQILIKIEKRFVRFLAIENRIKDILIFSNNHGYYISKIGLTPEEIFEETHIKGQGGFPYNFDRKYEAVENFKLFDGMQVVLNPYEKFLISDFMPYTFGLEFETSAGYIPEEICFRDGLIPLRDGSIAGLEYSTVVLQGNDGIALLKQQLDSLNTNTEFNKECSLHIHMGGFPLNATKLFNIHLICKRLESEIQNMIPRYTFHSGEYKDNGKDYCKRLKDFRNFSQMYEYLVGRRFFNDFTQPHPYDIRREAKWHINTRYFWVNFINALCYNVNKTIEFRLLRPTYNFKKILLWLYIFNAILRYAETQEVEHSNFTMEKIIRNVYPSNLANAILDGICRLKVLVVNQTRNGDYCGRDVHLETDLFPDSLNF